MEPPKEADDQRAMDAAARPSLPTRIISNPAVKYVVPLVVIAIAIYVLHDLASHVSWTAVKEDLASISPRLLIFSLLGTALSFVGIACYDVLGSRFLAPGKVPVRIAAMAGASGYAVSNLLGVSYLTGTALRYRIYSGIGLDITTTAGILAISWVAYWLGIILLVGSLLVLHPTGIATVLPISETTETAIGIALLVMLGVLIVYLRGGRKLNYGDFSLSLPSHGTTLYLIIAAVVDILGSALALYFLMPADLVASFPFFFVVYIGALALGILSHSPGGLGVFEAGMIAGLGAAGRSDVLAALLLYRLIYFVVPFAITCVGIAIVWSRNHHRSVGGAAKLSYQIVKPLVPALAAGISLLAGTVMLISGSLPAGEARLGFLRDIVPLSFVEFSHLTGSLVGVLLVVLSRGLFRRLRRAWLIAMILMAVGVVVSLIQGLAWVQALFLLGTMGLLGLFRPAFYRVGETSILRINGPWVLAIVALLAAIFWIGLFTYSHVEYQNALWWQFAWNGDASRFLRASFVVAIVFAAIIFNSIVMHRPQPNRQRHAIPAEVFGIVANSEDTDANISLMGDKDFLVSEDKTAFLAYADTGRSLISKGDPFGDEASGTELAWRLREMADQTGKRCAFYSVSSKLLPTYLDMGMSVLKIGEVARVDLQGFSLEGPSKRRFRQAKNRADREGAIFEIIPAAELAEIMPTLRKVSDAWLASKHGKEKSFALGAFDEEYLSNFDHAVLRDGETKEIYAFANLFKGANKQELSLDLMRHLPDGPKYAMDALFAELMLWGEAQGFHWFSLGAAPLSGLENRQLASLWNRIAGFTYGHGNHFYNFEGLREFKQKFDPVWSPNYLATQGGISVPLVLYEINQLVSGGVKGLIR